MRAKRNHVFNIQAEVSLEMKADIDAICARNGASQTNIVRMALAEYVERIKRQHAVLDEMETV